jgi:molecular chaperone GrpE (heat shock protein)
VRAGHEGPDVSTNPEKHKFNFFFTILGMQEKNTEILNYNNELANLQTRLEESQSRSLRWQAEWDRILKNASQKSLLLGQIKM